MRAQDVLLLAVLAVPIAPARARGLAPEAEKPAAAAPEDAAEAVVEDIPAPKAARSRVTAVTVYPTSALVTREVVVPEGKGTVQVVVTPLPSQVVAGSLYGEGAGGLRVLSTRFRQRAVKQDTRGDVRAKEDEIAKLEEEAARLKAAEKAAEDDREFLKKLESFTGASLKELTDKGKLDVEATVSLSKYVMDTRAKASTSAVDLTLKAQANARALDFARRELSGLSVGTARVEADAVIDVDKADADAGVLRLSYLVGASSWSPRYRIRAGGEKDPVLLEYLGAIEQRSGEDWADARITLSTSQPALNAMAPDLLPLDLIISNPMMGGGMGGMGGMGGGAAPAAKPSAEAMRSQAAELRDRARREILGKDPEAGQAMLNEAAALDQAAELLARAGDDQAADKGKDRDDARERDDPPAAEAPSVSFALKGRLSIPSGQAVQLVEVARTEMAPDYFYKTVPILSPRVYRLATLTNAGAHVLLPGEATIYVGDEFVGKMALPLVAVGEPFAVGLGVDPQIQVYRRLLSKAATEQGANQVHAYEFRIAVRSFKPRPVKLQVWDRLPRAESKAVAVRLTGTAPELSADKVYGRTGRRDNLLRWDLDVAPTAKDADPQQILYQFQLEFARGLTIEQLSAGGLHESPIGGGMGGMGGGFR